MRLLKFISVVWHESDYLFFISICFAGDFGFKIFTNYLQIVYLKMMFYYFFFQAIIPFQYIVS